MEEDTPPATVFKAPTRSEFLVMEPTCTDENPHCPSTAHNANSEKALTQYTGFQANDASWGTPIIPDHNNTSPSPPFCAGSTFYAKYKNARVDAVAVLEEVAGAGNVTVIMPQVKLVATKQAPRRKPGGKPDKFAGHISLLIRCSDLDIRTAFLDPATYAADQLLAFHITPFDATVLSWAVGFFKTDISDTPAATARRFRWAVYDKLTNTSPAPKAAALIDRATQGGNVLPREERVLNFAKTIQVRYLPHDTDPVYVLHAKPCTKDPKLWDEIRAALRITYTDLLEAFVPHANAATGHNLCANCKLDCHPRYNCMFTERDKGWWGPKSLEAIIRQINGGNSDSEGENRGNLSLSSEEDVPDIKRDGTQGKVLRSGNSNMCGACGHTCYCRCYATTAGLHYSTEMGDSGTVGGGSSATGARPTDDGVSRGGEMADAGPSGLADATPEAVRQQGGTRTSSTSQLKGATEPQWVMKPMRQHQTLTGKSS
ncbi:hypothetical protein B0H15DRAFT_799560 [Mycena belliarum]|uniref:Uncharacterized protein n=1 Tax=Mycena belliarum TaxID=1033014 RepID=A0AAD6XTW9_9AGAR|nr:hypothetical protein B0H15DRAFT_799560 [Mycena belliae]